MLRRLHALLATLLALLALLALAVGCGGGDDEDGRTAATTAAETRVAEDQAAVLVTTGCGKEVVVDKTEVEPGQTAMQALDRVADIETASGGKFVTEIEGIEQNEKKKLAWLFYVNGEIAQKGAAEIRLKKGDVQWWDLHNWEKECPSVPADAR